MNQKRKSTDNENDQPIKISKIIESKFKFGL